MAITYNKRKVSKNRMIQTRGPRDHQLERVPLPSDESALVEELRSQIKNLQERLDVQREATYTVDQVNEEVIKAVKSQTSALEAEVAGLKKELAALNRIISEKDEMIKYLRESQTANIGNNVTDLIAEAAKKLANSSDQEVSDSDRPKMGRVFIDPIEKPTKVETHLTVKETKGKAKMQDKLSKLRSLKGK